jgi:hypothetical protein
LDSNVTEHKATSTDTEHAGTISQRWDKEILDREFPGNAAEAEQAWVAHFRACTEVKLSDDIRRFKCDGFAIIWDLEPRYLSI